ncbi:hypothetical protein PRIPAC_72479 [Pristionchus pacificus]|uniref:Zinc finger protein n=1 Tax=Pristionchus pacificus TaxID=54126 RepID=A0A2A6CQQ8_PRIPA|nr:hypothetical protein PRIPAC_72479 [Pristionchus pacificus]|eukprot:PDM80545.1 zinc finger protein [Pristionchus pacificus]
MADADSERISQLQMEAIQFSFTDKLGSVVQKGIEAAQSMHRKESLDELEFAKTSLHSQMEIVSRWDKNRDDFTRKQIYALCEILEIMIKDRINSSNSLFSSADTVEDPNFDNIEIIVDDEVKQESLEGFFEEANYSTMNEESNQSLMATTPLPLFAKISNVPMEQEDKYEKMENTDGDDDFLKNSDDSDENMDNGDNNTPNRNKIRRFPCKYCHDAQPSKKELLSHMTNHHAEKVRMHTCKVCGIVSASRTHHLQHIATHSNFEKGKRTYKCQGCEKTFASLTTLSQHANSHSDDLLVRRPFKCDFCEYRATQKQALQRHVKTHER